MTLLLPPCARCEEEFKTTKDIAGAMIVIFESPLMSEQSPPTLLCHECTTLVVEFMMPSIADSPKWRRKRHGDV